MILVDANLLIYARVSDSPNTKQLGIGLTGSSTGSRAWPSLAEPSGLRPPILEPADLSEAPDYLRSVATGGEWMDCPPAWTPEPTEKHGAVLATLIPAVGNRPHPFPDANLAALALQYGLTLCPPTPTLPGSRAPVGEPSTALGSSLLLQPLQPAFSTLSKLLALSQGLVCKIPRDHRHQGQGRDASLHKGDTMTANDRFKKSFTSWLWGSMILATAAHFAVLRLWPELSAQDLSRDSGEILVVELPPDVIIPPDPEPITRPASPVVSTVDIDENITISPTTFENNPVDRLPPPPDSALTTRITETPTFTPFTVKPGIRNREEVRQALIREYPPLLTGRGDRRYRGGLVSDRRRRCGSTDAGEGRLGACRLGPGRPDGGRGHRVQPGTEPRQAGAGVDLPPHHLHHPVGGRARGPRPAGAPLIWFRKDGLRRRRGRGRCSRFRPGRGREPR